MKYIHSELFNFMLKNVYKIIRPTAEIYICCKFWESRSRVIYYFLAELPFVPRVLYHSATFDRFRDLPSVILNPFHGLQYGQLESRNFSKDGVGLRRQRRRRGGGTGGGGKNFWSIFLMSIHVINVYINK